MLKLSGLNDSVAVSIKVENGLVRLVFKTRGEALVLHLGALEAAFLTAQLAFASAKLLESKPPIITPR